MLESGNLRWRKLDNAALAFPAVTGKDDTRVFRFYCQLKEDVDGAILQQALDQTLETYPLFRAVLRKGLFWFYLEGRDLPAIVREESKIPCSTLYIPDKKTLLFQVTYYKKRINFEVFHALTDGTGAMHFLQELVKNYLRTAHPEENLPNFGADETVTDKDREEDSFSQYYSSRRPRNRERKPAAVQLKGEKVSQEELRITQIVLPVKETLAKARSYGVSITVLLAAMMLCAIRDEIPAQDLNKPVALMIPVNLRNYFPSQSMNNFFGWIEVGYRFTETTTFQEVVNSVKEQFARELDRDRIASRMNDLVRLEKNPLLRIVPLEVKKFFLMAGTNFGGRSITGVYSNVGVIRLPEEYQKYISRFGLFASTDSLQMCSCSYGDEMVLGITSKIQDNNIQRNLRKMLDEEELPHHLEENDFPGKPVREGKTVKTVLSCFTFLCVIATILSGLINYVIAGRLDWSWFVAAGCLCAWLLVMVGYTKRRNILKNQMWQLLLISVGCILWDRFTGWYGWSVDFVLPLGTLAVLCSIVMIVWIGRLPTEEYLVYLVQDLLFGLIPGILLLTGIVGIPYPSVICAAICVVTLVGLLIFRRRDMLREGYKKLRL